MFEIPSPLHPAIVHFPIVLILVGGIMAVAAVLLPRWKLPAYAGILLTLGAIGSLVAAQTGESAQELLGELPDKIEAVLDTHEDWAERTEFAAWTAAALAIVAAVLTSRAAARDDIQILPPQRIASQPGSTKAKVNGRELRTSGGEGRRQENIGGWMSVQSLAFVARSLAGAGAIAACFCVYQTGRRGGELVYRHHVGMPQQAVSAATGTEHRVHHDKDND